LIDKHRLVLASKSPRRREILKALGINFSIVSVDTDETIVDGISPEKQAVDIAKNKALAALRKVKTGLILSADTIVVLHDGTVLGKPINEEDAYRMLNKLQGATHTVITAIALYDTSTEILLTDFDKSEVTFLPMSEEEIRWYISTGEPMDKAGAYGLQEKGMLFVQKINGSPSNVIGLPTHTLYQLLKKMDINLFEYFDFVD
jgi:septum formation protein